MGITLVKYKNRKIYNPKTSKYMNLKTIGQLATASKVTVVTHGENKDVTKATMLKAMEKGHLDKITLMEYL